MFPSPATGEMYHRDSIAKLHEKILKDANLEHIPLHSLRHSFAVAAIRAGDDIKTVQGNLGHHAASFTLDVYGHVTDQMKRESAQRMENFIRGVAAG